ncbi:ROK family protein [Dysgonomonas sp. 521]|uniref:ROK family protein n=1 Tax=Dysgonomonas sp. 521 TaxID=2302932 RepID=UPI0013D49D07|nr:ROK family protein [Dysgonomonas sp. 521]NDV94534.1 ROK family protein [Dysgonomonas sp. 521]
MSVIGIDLGGTKITGALFDPQGNVLQKTASLLEHRQGKEVGLLITETIDNLISDCRTDVNAIGICIPGIANSQTGKVWAPNIKGWEDYPLQQELENHYHHIKINIASDRTCYILGETWKGAAIGCSNALFIAVGTGIGVGILIDGHILHGHGDIVGAAGWLALNSTYQDEYKAYGCFESHASGNGIARQAKKILEEGRLFKDSVLCKKEIESVTTQDIFRACEENDPLAKHVLYKAVELWGMASANLVSLLNPEKIVWGGGVFGPATQFLDHIYDEACRWAQPISIKQVKFEKSQLCGDAGLYGAGHLALRSLK